MLLTSKSSLGLWHEVIQGAEQRCQVALEGELESYLISLLMQYTDKPQVVRQIFAEAFLKALQLRELERNASLKNVGDQCLLFAGLFPHAAKRRQVKISYFVDLGRSAYAGVSKRTNDLFSSLAIQFVVLMDVLQSIGPSTDLLPLEAYEQWDEVGSQRALNILKEYTNAIPIKKSNR